MTPEKDSIAPPYLAFKTFQSAVDGLRAHGLPATLDRTAWETKSGTDQSQILGALRFFKFTDDKGLTQDSLRQLVATPANSEVEKKLLNSIVLASYDKVFSSVDLANATPKQLADAIGMYGVGGVVRDRAVRFFLKAAKHTGITLSSRLTMKMRERDSEQSPANSESEDSGPKPPAPPQRQKRKARPNVPPPAPPAPPSRGSPAANAMKTIELPKVGGSLSVTGTFNAFQLMGDERELVYQIIDLMTAYEGKAASGK